MSGEPNKLENEPFKSHSAKLKRVFVELHDYSFSHGTSDKSNSDNEFIGRERELKRFQSTLTNSSQKSGIYLVTGYRGMGKTSFVNKALDSTYQPPATFIAFFKWIKSLFIVFLLLEFVLIISKLFSDSQLTVCNIDGVLEIRYFLSLIIFLILFIICLLIFVFNEKLYLKQNIAEFKFYTFLKSILSKTYCNQVKDTNSKHLYYLEYFTTLSFFATLTAFTTNILYQSKHQSSQYIKWDIFNVVQFEFLLIAGYIFFFSIFYISYWFCNKKSIEISLFDDFLKPIRKFFNYSHTIIVKLNLGHSNLNEISILKLITRNIKSNFEQQRRKFTINKFFWIIIVFAIILFTCLIYKTEPVTNINSYVRNSLNINVFFPSQNERFLNNSDDELNKIVEALEGRNKFNSEYYYIYTQSIAKNRDDSIGDALNYLNSFDKNLTSYLNINKLEGMPCDSFVESFRIKKNIFFKLNGSYKQNYYLSNKMFYDAVLDFQIKGEKKSLNNEDKKILKKDVQVFINFLENIKLIANLHKISNEKYGDYIFNSLLFNKSTIEDFKKDTSLIGRIDGIYDYSENTKLIDKFNNLLSESITTKEIESLNVHINNLLIKGQNYSQIFEQIIALKSNLNLASQQLDLSDNLESLIFYIDSSKFINSSELSSLISYRIENKNAFLNSSDINILFLYKLNEISKLQHTYGSYSIIVQKIIALTNYIDYLVHEGYYFVRKFLLADSKKVGFILLPYHLDYLLLIYIFIFYYIFCLIHRIFTFSKPTLRDVNKKLVFINELIDANISISNGANIQTPQSFFSFSKTKNKNYPQADEREIEKYLIEVINDINNLTFFNYRSDFIIVFDELDKIEPIVEKNNEKSILYSPEAIRLRLQTVMKLLSNLKYFLSTAQAKFIFIAGREMYDASLADVSDRNFRIGSIFHDIFYINSFYSDIAEYDIGNITSRTEQYVCQFLTPNNIPIKSLKEYSKYLNLKEYNPAENDKTDNTKDKNEDVKVNILKQKEEKVIYLLKQFIVYLNHQSAGAPSKIKAYFENYVVSKDMMNHPEKNSLYAGNKNSQNLFLFFDYYDQYELGLVNYLITPFNYTINKSIRNYGDKLIVSASFLHNHLFKFHRNAFSWRELESTPEMVDINKNPELRDFLGRLMEFMQQTQIKKVIDGIYNFKFPKKLSQELLFLSHISEEASANFNFTLDESLIVKQHYKDQLNKLKENKESNDNYIFSISSINLTLGDLCFYDGDLGEAIVYFLEAIQQMRNKKVEDLTITQLSLLTRDMLKLGYALEKRKTYDSAFLTYNEIANKIQDWINAKRDEKNKLSENDRDTINSVLENINYLYQPLLARLYLTEKLTINGITISDLQRIYTDFDLLQSILKRNYVYKDSGEKNKTIENEDKRCPIEIGFWNHVGNLLYYKNVDYQTTIVFGTCIPNEHNLVRPCSACMKYFDSFNLFIKENGFDEIFKETNKINDIDIKKYLNGLNNLIENKNKTIITNIEYHHLASLLSNIGDIFLCCSDSNKTISPSFLEELDEYFISNNIQKFFNDIHIQFFNSDSNANSEKEHKLELMITNYLCSAYFFRLSNDHKSASNQYLNILNFINVYLYNAKNINGIEDSIKNITEKISNRAIEYVYCSYDHIHNYEIKQFQSIFAKNDKKYFDDILLKKISINTDLDEINLVKFNIDLKIANSKDSGVKWDKAEYINIYNSISPYSINTNMYNRILKLRLRENMNWIIFTKDLSIIDITLEMPEPETILTNFIQDEDYTFLTKSIKRIEMIEYLIADSIFCCSEISKICSTFDPSFSLNHSLLAENHLNFWKWCQYLDTYLILLEILRLSKISIDKAVEFAQKKNSIIKKENETDIETLKEIINRLKDTNDKNKYIIDTESLIIENIKKLIEPDNYLFVSQSYQLEKTINCFYAMKYSHKQGDSYRNFIENMYFMNDDFNDELYHFSAALERYKINCDFMKNSIDNLKKQKINSQLYDSKKYMHEYNIVN